MNEAFWLIDQLVQENVTHFCIAPGSRSTPLVLAATHHPKATTRVHFDERGLGFYALGYGKAAQVPAAIIVTSGTAVANLLPSIMEAHHSHTPLIVLTADRPCELRQCGAQQTTDQVKIFSSFLRFEADLPPSLSENYFRSIAAQSVFYALNFPHGPVQLNCQIREPFEIHNPTGKQGRSILFPKPLLNLQEDIHVSQSRGLILIGSLPPSNINPILNLAKRIKWPIFADILSQARSCITEEQILHFDWMIQDLVVPPDFILHFGGRMTSKNILKWPVSLRVDPSPDLQDPNRVLCPHIQSDYASFANRFFAPSDPDWFDLLKRLDQNKQLQFLDLFASNPVQTEASWMHHIGQHIPPHSSIFLGNGMPIRDANHFLFPKNSTVFFANRGVSGIDGNIATAVGIAERLQKPMVAILGDQAVLHDLNSLALLKKSSFPITLIVFNNFGGGIFHHLPIREWEHFETHVACSHQWSFAHAASLFDLHYASDLDSCSFDRSSLIELTTSRQTNEQFHQLCKKLCSTKSF